MTSPDGLVPSGNTNAYQASSVHELQDVTQESIAAQKNLWLQQALEEVRDQVLNGLLGGFASVPLAIIDAIRTFAESILGTTISGPIGTVLDTVAGWFGGLTKAARGVNPGSGTGITSVITSIFGFQSATANTATTAASAATSAYDLAVANGNTLDGISGYASRYMSSGPGVNTTPAVMPFDTNVGGTKNVTWLSGGKARFDKAGLWRLEAQVRFWGATLAPPRCYMDIVVRDAGGTIVKRIKAMASTDDEVTVTNVMPVQIPAAGYTAEVQAWTSGLPLINSNWRGIGGGSETTRFSMFRFSPEAL